MTDQDPTTTLDDPRRRDDRHRRRRRRDPGRQPWPRRRPPAPRARHRATAPARRRGRPATTAPPRRPPSPRGAARRPRRRPLGRRRRRRPRRRRHRGRRPPCAHRRVGDRRVLAWSPADRSPTPRSASTCPGDQRAELGQFLRAFPGFDDQAAFHDQDQRGARPARRQGVGRQADVHGRTSSPGSAASSPSASAPCPTDAPDRRRLDAARPRPAVESRTRPAPGLGRRAVDEDGATTTTETYNGVTITSSRPADAGRRPQGRPTRSSRRSPSLGDVDSVKAAIDTGGKTGLAPTSSSKAASRPLTATGSPSPTSTSQRSVDATEGLAERRGGRRAGCRRLRRRCSTAARLVAVGGPGRGRRLRQSRSRRRTSTPSARRRPRAPRSRRSSRRPPSPSPRATTSASASPAHRAALRLRPDSPTASSRSTTPLALIGGLDALIGWMGEVGVAVTADGDTLGGGVVIVPTDAAAASGCSPARRPRRARRRLGSGIKVTDEDLRRHDDHDRRPGGPRRMLGRPAGRRARSRLPAATSRSRTP